MFNPEWDEGHYADHAEIMEADVDESMAAALRQIEANYLADIAAGYTREEARLRRAKALQVAHAPKRKAS